MPVEQKNIIVAKADVSVGDYIAAGAAGTLVTVGHIKGPVTLETTWENYEIESENQLGSLKSIPTKAAHRLKFAMIESLLDPNIRISLKNVVAQRSGTTPNFTLAVTDAAEQYHQIAVATKAFVGATGVQGTRVITIWKAAVEALDAIGFTKGGEQMLSVTVNCLFDETITTPLTLGRYMRIVDAAIS